MAEDAGRLGAIWSAVRRLEGQTLHTRARRQPFTITDVRENSVHYTAGPEQKPRQFSREIFARALEIRQSRNELTPSALQQEVPSTQDASYVVAVLEAALASR